MKERTRKTVKSIITSACTLAMLAGAAACGQSAEDAAAEQSRKEAEKQKVLDDLGAVRLKDDLKGSCDGSNSMLPTAVMHTKDGLLYMSFYGEDRIHPSDFESWSVMLTNVDGSRQQVQATRHVNGLTDRSVFDFDTNHNWEAGVGDFDLDPSDPEFLQTAIDTTHLYGKAGLKWQVTLSVDGEDVAVCPAVGTETLEKAES